MSQETRLTHAAQVLLGRAEKAFEAGNRIRGINLLKDCLELLSNGYERLLEESFQPAEQPDEQPAEQPVEQTTPAALALGESESKAGAGVVSEPAEQESKDGAGVVSDPKKSQTQDGSGIA